MKITKDINYIDGGKDYNRVVVLEYKDYIVADVQKVQMMKDEDGNDVEQVMYSSRVWFPLDTPYVPLKDYEIDYLKDGIPDTRWTKALIQDWLTRNNIEWNGSMTKDELLALVEV